MTLGPVDLGRRFAIESAGAGIGDDAGHSDRRHVEAAMPDDVADYTREGLARPEPLGQRLIDD